MGVGSSLVNSIVDAATGSNSGTTLEQFLSKFGSSEGKYVNQINPLNTFDVDVIFEPGNEFTSQSLSSKILGILGTAATSAIKNIGNNITGGLLGSLLNKTNFDTEKSGFNDKGKHTFLEYLAKANLIVGGENWFNSTQTTSPLTLQLGFYTQSITIPKLKMPDGQKVQTIFGDFPVNGQYVIPDNNTLQLELICTKLPLHERIFYPWMREVTLPQWSYETQPYTTATITIDFNKHTDMKYVFLGCRPCQIDTIQPTQEPNSSITRQVTIMFNYMYITSNMTTTESATSKLLSTGKALFNSSSNMLNF